ncbi:hypothetical protein QAD02_008857 [Eretmocerus hayati]|uniref:Uncharacterized protein n=1 Tax=Eretmocerus hayati TaxID=131215 RepID=A0ACC2N7M8_9HYME|nr:hypothetical protein QAD02_008857 [Eretmocerus hayati]
MYFKLLIFVLLGGTLVLAHPKHERNPKNLQADEVVLRSTFLEKVDEFLQKLIGIAKKLIGAAKRQCEKLVKLYIEFKEKAKTEIRELIAKLTNRLVEAKDNGQIKYEQVKEEVVSTLKEKEKKVEIGLKEIQEKIKTQVDEMLDKAPRIDVTAKVVAEEVQTSDPLITPGPSNDEFRVRN